MAVFCRKCNIGGLFLYKKICPSGLRFVITQHPCDIVQSSAIVRSNHARPRDKSGNRKLFFLFLNQNICCGYSKEPSR